MSVVLCAYSCGAGDRLVEVEFLKSKLLINMIMCENSEFSLIDKIVTVCCALCNCCDSVVPSE